MPYPDFLCIGAAKCGTSWLHVNLKRHRQIFVPYVKEIHYFDGQAYDHPNDFIRRLFHPGIGYWRRPLKRQLFKRESLTNKKRRRWLLNYIFGIRNDEWYASLFRPGDGQISGEHTPGYYSIGLEHVERIHKLMPNCKIIFLIRNPVEQIWSMVKFMHFKIYKKKFEEMSHDDLRNICNEEFRVRNADFLLHLSKWEKIFPKENIFIGFNDEISEDPKGFLLRIFDFLGVESESYYFRASRRVINKGPDYDLPDDIRIMLSLKMYDSLKKLHERFGSYATKWLEEETKFLERHGALPESEPSSLRSKKYCLTP